MSTPILNLDSYRDFPTGRVYQYSDDLVLVRLTYRPGAAVEFSGYTYSKELDGYLISRTEFPSCRESLNYRPPLHCIPYQYRQDYRFRHLPVSRD
jgi:hypothetical protein